MTERHANKRQRRGRRRHPPWRPGGGARRGLRPASLRRRPHHLPPLTPAIGNASYTIPSSLYVLSGDVNGGNRIECVSAFIEGGDPFWLMGDVFFRAVYAVLDVEHKLYGMARNVNLGSVE